MQFNRGSTLNVNENITQQIRQSITLKNMKFTALGVISHQSFKHFTEITIYNKYVYIHVHLDVFQVWLICHSLRIISNSSHRLLSSHFDLYW